jgi:RimJ/RimL family protein N-acetyltransferase
LEGEAELSVCLDKAERGRGLGTTAIRQASDLVLTNPVIKQVIARVVIDNPISIATFQKAGFIQLDNSGEIVEDTYKLVYTGHR